MKHYKEFPLFPVIRRSFKSIKELGNVINRSESYVGRCLNGRQAFSTLEKQLILSAIGIPATEENMLLYFSDEKGG